MMDTEHFANVRGMFTNWYKEDCPPLAFALIGLNEEEKVLARELINEGGGLVFHRRPNERWRENCITLCSYKLSKSDTVLADYEEMFDLKYILDSARSGQLLRLAEYRLNSVSKYENYNPTEILFGFKKWSEIPRKSGGTIPGRGKRKLGYSKKQDFQILNYIIKKKCYKNLIHIKTWQKMEKNGVCEGKRTWISMRNRFRNILFNNLHNYHLSPRQIRQMRGSVNPDELHSEDDWSSPILSSDDEQPRGTPWMPKLPNPRSVDIGIGDTIVEDSQHPPVAHLQIEGSRSSPRKRKLYNPRRSFVSSPTPPDVTAGLDEDMFASTPLSKRRHSKLQKVEHGSRETGSTKDLLLRKSIVNIKKPESIEVLTGDMLANTEDLKDGDQPEIEQNEALEMAVESTEQSQEVNIQEATVDVQRYAASAEIDHLLAVNNLELGKLAVTPEEFLNNAQGLDGTYTVSESQAYVVPIIDTLNEMLDNEAVVNNPENPAHNYKKKANASIKMTFSSLADKSKCASFKHAKQANPPALQRSVTDVESNVSQAIPTKEKVSEKKANGHENANSSRVPNKASIQQIRSRKEQWQKEMGAKLLRKMVKNSKRTMNEAKKKVSTKAAKPLQEVAVTVDESLTERENRVFRENLENHRLAMKRMRSTSPRTLCCPQISSFDGREGGERRCRRRLGFNRFGASSSQESRSLTPTESRDLEDGGVKSLTSRKGQTLQESDRKLITLGPNLPLEECGMDSRIPESSRPLQEGDTLNDSPQGILKKKKQGVIDKKRERMYRKAYRKRWKDSEDIAMIDYFRKHGGISNRRACSIWNVMEKSFVVPGRSWGGMRRRFLNIEASGILEKKYGTTVEELYRHEAGHVEHGKLSGEGSPADRLYSKHFYTPVDDTEIVAFITRTKRFKDIATGCSLWKEMEERKLLPGRSWQSLRQRFHKHLMRKILDNKIEMTEEDRAAFEAVEKMIERRSRLLKRK